MSFNLKKKKAQNINDQSSLDSYVQMLITQLNQANMLPTDDALNRLTDMSSLTDYGIQSFEDLRDIIMQQQATMEQQQDMQNNMVAPAQPAGSPVVLTPPAIAAKVKNKMIKPFNLKKAQQPEVPFDPMGLNNSPEMMGDQLQMQNEVNQESILQPPFLKMEDFKKWIDNTDSMEVLQALTTPHGDEIKQLMEQYFTLDDEGQKGVLAAQIFNDPNFPPTLKQEQGIMTQREHFGEVQKIIKKLAEDTVKKNKQKPFNLTKTAQHKALENAILWGPEQSQIDPFLHQPVSDWHIVERNKGFGLVVDDVWNIDYETIWRENIMDKFSRPYRNKDGDWVGGYLHKRFEMDKNIPATSNYQLKPGEIRKPILPEYGNTESRLQAARAAGDIEGAIDTSKPFNWKEASKKKS